MKWKSYPKYWDSGIDWLGEIPEGWTIKRFRFLFSVIKGRNPELLTENEQDGMLPYVTMNYLRTGVPESYAFPNRTSVMVNNGDFAVLWDGSKSGEFVLCRKGILGSTLAKCINTRMLDSRFAYYACKAIEPQMQELTVGMGIPHLDGELLGNMVFAIPELPEQYAIAAFLDRETERIDLLIAKKERQIELLQEKRTALIHQSVTKGNDPDLEMKESGFYWLGKIPRHWEVIRVKRVCQVFIPQRNKPELNSSDGLPWITMEDIFTPVVDRLRATRFVTEGAALEANSKVLPKGSVIASCVGDFGISSVNTEPVIINQQLQAYIPQEIDASFLRYFIGISRPYFESVANATTIYYVNRESFGELPVVLPSYPEQLAIVEFLDQETSRNDALSKKILESIERLREFRLAIIFAVVTGKIGIHKEGTHCSNPQVVSS